MCCVPVLVLNFDLLMFLLFGCYFKMSMCWYIDVPSRWHWMYGCVGGFVCALVLVCTMCCSLAGDMFAPLC
jgi:hypothetical protein